MKSDKKSRSELLGELDNLLQGVDQELNNSRDLKLKLAVDRLLDSACDGIKYSELMEMYPGDKWQEIREDYIAYEIGLIPCMSGLPYPSWNNLVVMRLETELGLWDDNTLEDFERMYQREQDWLTQTRCSFD